MPANVATNRAFFPQDTVDHWLADGRVRLDGQVLALLPDGPAFQLESAVLFQTEVSSGEDAHGLCGKVKSLEALAQLSGEHAPGSVVMGDNAYEVLDGFLGELVLVTLADPADPANETDQAARAAHDVGARKALVAAVAAANTNQAG
jgi:hypothetical protein